MLHYTPNPVLSLRVAPRAYVPNVLQQAEFEQLTISRKGGSFSVEILLTVTQYNSENGALGLRLEGRGIESYPVTLRGNNNTAVDFAGNVLLMREGNHDSEVFTESSADFKARAEADERQLMLQGNYVEHVFFNEPVKLADLIRDAIEKANGSLHNRFAQ